MKSKQFSSGCLCALLAALAATAARADVRLPGLFSDNMVLQQGMPVPIWGWADDGEQVRVTFHGHTATAKAKDGKWMLKLAALKGSSEPEMLLIEGKNRLELKNVLVGEVWVCSGQSNMELPL